jgi:hypothetical protein
MATKIQFRRDTASNWTTTNPTLNQGEPGFETDTGKLKVGNGTDTWTALPYGDGIVGDNGQIAVGYQAGQTSQSGWLLQLVTKLVVFVKVANRLQLVMKLEKIAKPAMQSLSAPMLVETAKVKTLLLLVNVQVKIVKAAMLSQLVMKLAMAAVANSNVLRLP